MRMVDLIEKKRDGGVLSREEIDFLIRGVVDGTIPDYQTTAFLMAMYFQKPDHRETVDLTLAMAASGETFDLSALPGVKVDKHSTGGVADTTTLIAAPLAAACGVPVVKMSGRGLGFTGGTLDKLEAIPGFRVDLGREEALAIAGRIGLVVMGQTGDLDPADKRLYALRDVTGTIRNLPLITSSILSKKLAAGADAIVLDVKCGSGAFMRTRPEAEALAREMVAIGRGAGKKVTALVSNMEEPLGQLIGNALEVREAAACLKGEAPGALTELSLTLAGHMAFLGGKASSPAAGQDACRQALKSGAGLQKLREMIKAQGGDAAFLEDPAALPLGRATLTVTAPVSGYVSRMDTAQIGRAAQLTGAGRAVLTDRIDPGAGIAMAVRLGDWVEAGAPLATLYAATDALCATAAEVFRQAVHLAPEKPSLPDLVLETFSTEESR